MNHDSILLSIKPMYAEMIFNGKKTIELRRKLPKNINKGSLILVYASSPQKLLLGAFTVKKIISSPLISLWEKVNKKSCIDMKDFDTYFSGCKIGYGICIDNYWSFPNPVSLEDIRTIDEGFNIPQSFRYLKESDLHLFSYQLGIVF
ncbi:MAG: ASCH domain-containing protein [Melioribacteraceae bacterium]